MANLSIHTEFYGYSDTENGRLRAGVFFLLRITSRYIHFLYGHGDHKCHMLENQLFRVFLFFFGA